MSRALRLLALALLLPTAAMAQHPQTREGFGISFGFGAGSSTFTCGECAGEDWGGSGVSGYLRLGGYVRPNLLLAGETNGWNRINGDLNSASIGAVLAVAQWYPMVKDGLYLKGGVGYTYSSATTDYGDVGSSGFGLSLGAGYDWRIARNFALTPNVSYLTQLGGTIKVSGVDSGVSATVHVFQFGLGLTWF